MATKKTTKSTAKPTKPAPKLDIFKEMAEADKRNLYFYESLMDDEKKAFAPLVAMRWFSAVSDRSGLSDYYIIMANDVVNIGFWELSKHPDLLWKLMAVAGSGQMQRHQWIPMAKKRGTSKLDNLLLSLHPSLSDYELEIYKGKLTKDSLKRLMLDLAMLDTEIKPIMEEFKKLDNGSGKED